jgi:transcriptional regulator with XRE-family HTH domain
MVAQTPLAETLDRQGRLQTWLAMQLAARLGRPVYKQEVSRWALGTTMPEFATREAIAEILGVAVSDLFPAHAQGVSVNSASSDEDERTAA